MPQRAAEVMQRNVPRYAGGITALLFLLLAIQGVGAVSITHFIPVTADTENPAELTRLFAPELTTGATLKVFLRTTGAAVHDGAGNSSSTITIYRDDILHTRFATRYSTPEELTSDSYSQWQLLDITMPAEPGQYEIELVVRDFQESNERLATASSSFTCYLTYPDGLSGSYSYPPLDRGLVDQLAGFGLINPAVSMRGNTIVVQYDIRQETSYSSLLTGYLTAFILAATTFPNSGTVAVIPSLDGIPVLRSWADTPAIMELSFGELSAVGFIRDHLSTDFSVYQNLFPASTTLILPLLQDGPLRYPEIPGSYALQLIESFDTVDTGEPLPTVRFEGISGQDYIAVHDGRLQLFPEESGLIVVSDQQVGEGIISVETEKIAGAASAGYGVIFDVEDDGSYSFFITGGTGMYAAGKAASGSYELTIPWSSSEAVLEEQPNRLSLRLGSDTVTGYCNATELFFYPRDWDGSEKQAGLITSAGLSVAFDNFTIHSPRSTGFSYTPAPGATVFNGIVIKKPVVGDTVQQQYFLTAWQHIPDWAGEFSATLRTLQQERLLTTCSLPDTCQNPLERTLGWIAHSLPESTVNQVQSTAARIAEHPRLGALLLDWGLLLLDSQEAVGEVWEGSETVLQSLTGLIGLYARQLRTSGSANYNYARARLQIQTLLDMTVIAP